MIPYQNILRLNISMGYLPLLQQFQDIEHSTNKTIDLLNCEELQLFPTKADVLQHVHLIFLHKDQNCFVLFSLLFFLVLLQSESRSLLPTDLGFEDASSEDGDDSWYARFQLTNFF
jgi:hypothetical protein